jgi:hypothetical protein
VLSTGFQRRFATSQESTEALSCPACGGTWVGMPQFGQRTALVTWPEPIRR